MDNCNIELFLVEHLFVDQDEKRLKMLRDGYSFFFSLQRLKNNAKGSLMHVYQKRRSEGEGGRREILNANEFLRNI